MRKEEKRAVEGWVEFTQCGMGNRWNRRRDQREEKRIEERIGGKTARRRRGAPRLAISSLQRVSGAEFGADWVEPMSTSRAGRLSLTVTYANSFPVPPIKPVSLVTQLFHKLRANHKP